MSSLLPISFDRHLPRLDGPIESYSDDRIIGRLQYGCKQLLVPLAGHFLKPVRFQNWEDIRDLRTSFLGAERTGLRVVQQSMNIRNRTTLILLRRFVEAVIVEFVASKWIAILRNIAALIFANAKNCARAADTSRFLLYRFRRHVSSWIHPCRLVEDHRQPHSAFFEPLFGNRRSLLLVGLVCRDVLL